MPDTAQHLPDFDTLWDMDQPQATEARFREILPAARLAADTSYLCELLTQLARTEGLQGKFESAHSTLDEADGLSRDDMPRTRVRCLLERGRVFNTSGHKDSARPLFLQAWELAQANGEEYLAVDAAHMMGIVEPPDQKLVWELRALAFTEASGDPHTRTWLGSLYNNLGWTYHDLGQYDMALDLFQRGLAWRQQQSNPRATRIAAWSVARALRSMDRYDEALELQRENLREAATIGDTAGFIPEEIGELLSALGCLDEAKPYFAAAYAALSLDPWLQRDESERLERMRQLGGVPSREPDDASDGSIPTA